MKFNKIKPPWLPSHILNKLTKDDLRDINTAMIDIVTEHCKEKCGQLSYYHSNAYIDRYIKHALYTLYEKLEIKLLTKNNT